MYEQSIRDIDRGVNKLLSLLDWHGLLKDSSIFILSDHGDLLGEHRLLGHRRLIHNELLKIPTIIYENDISGGGNVYKKPITQLGIYKLILMSREYPVSKSISAPSQYNEDEIFCEMYCDESYRMYLHQKKHEINLFKLDEIARRLFSVIRSDKKLTYYQTEGKYVLSDLSDKVLEMSPANNFICQDMVETLKQHMNEENESRGVSRRRYELHVAISSVIQKIHMKLENNDKGLVAKS